MHCLRAKKLGIRVNIKEYQGEDSDSLSHEFLWMIDKPIDVEIRSGEPSPQSAKHIIGIFKESVKKTISKEFDALVTCPINKELLKGHLEFDEHYKEQLIKKKCLMNNIHINPLSQKQ